MFLNIINDIEDYFNNHNQVFDYVLGDITNLSTVERKFPLVWLQPKNSPISEYQIKYSFDIYSLTLYEQDKTNLINGLNDTHLIIKDFISNFDYNSNDEYWLDVNDLNLNVISGEFDNYLVGWHLTFNFISELDYDNCNLPTN